MEGDLFLGYCDITNDRVTVVIEINNATQLGPVEFQCSAENPSGRTPNVSATIDLTGIPFIHTCPFIPPSVNQFIHHSSIYPSIQLFIDPFIHPLIHYSIHRSNQYPYSTL